MISEVCVSDFTQASKNRFVSEACNRSSPDSGHHKANFTDPLACSQMIYVENISDANVCHGLLFCSAFVKTEVSLLPEPNSYL